ncbi:MAG: hypothetical protein SAJ12_09495 [Jaaginema sp. PMC 1079.18]|nr:hypothetical protein [Jaaginema sp. PMC 1080.18]MEC4851234.1 hypothetical protein [Jaaginema sp. PMC 1079.18]MEC4866354.1 hypothetical protein [Jaaginema sp. PMC 1078.18]
MRSLSSWIPNLNAGLSALVLVLLMSGIAVSGKYLFWLIRFLSKIAPQLGIIGGLALYLAPIALIAILHHILQLYFDRRLPIIRSQGLEPVAGWFPTLMSWWEGLYGWLVMALATVMGNVVLILIFAQSQAILNPLDAIAQPSDLTIPLLLRAVWLVVAAYLYQFESHVRQHLIAVGMRQTPETPDNPF